MPSFFGGKPRGAFGQLGNCMTTVSFEKEFFLKKKLSLFRKTIQSDRSEV